MVFLYELNTIVTMEKKVDNVEAREIKGAKMLYKNIYVSFFIFLLHATHCLSGASDHLCGGATEVRSCLTGPHSELLVKRLNPLADRVIQGVRKTGRAGDRRSS